MVGNSRRSQPNKLIIYTNDNHIILKVDGCLKGGGGDCVQLGVSVALLFSKYFSKRKIQRIFQKIEKSKESLSISLGEYEVSISSFVSSGIKFYLFIIESTTILDHSNVALAQDYLINIILYSPGFIYLKDVQFRYVMCNENFAKVAGLSSPNEIVGKTDYDLVWRKTEADLFRKGDIEALSGIKKINFEEPQLQVDGSTKIVLANKVPLYNSKQQVIGILGNYLDITDRKTMEKDLLFAKEAAEAASRAKTEFIANMGHDIRTPLTGIIGMSNILEEELSRPEEKEYATIIQSSGEQLLGLLNGVLDLITADATTEETVLHESFDVRQVIQDIVELERPAVLSHYLDISTNVDESIPCYIVGDKMKLHRILLNLAGNAIKFTKTGHIEINAKCVAMQDDEVHIEFEVKDTGIGIPEELQNQVFDRFFKVTPSYKGLYTGNGIGLHIVQKYVSLLGGNIRLTSEVGVGTTFSFILPMKVGEALEGDVTLARQNLPIDENVVFSSRRVGSSAISQSFKPRVLLVEDNLAVMRVLKSMVQKYDVQVSSAMNAELAYQLVQSHSFDLIITDVGLSGKQGDELTAMIRAFEKEHQRQPTMIVGLTGHAVGSITDACLAAGMNMVYRKPIAPCVLQSLIEAIIPKEEDTKAPLSSEVSLGIDLPANEADLFELSHYPLLDIELAVSLLGSEAAVREIYRSFKVEGIDADLAVVHFAHEHGDWDTVELLAHKMKGGAVFGTVRLYYALLYMERYRKAGHSRCLEKLYCQMLQVINETVDYLEEWLSPSQ